jgi:hypothetical protein
MPRERTVQTETEMHNMVDEYVQDGYNVKSSTSEQSMVKESGYGSFVFHLVIFIMTFGFGNIPYIIFVRQRADTIRIVVGKESTDSQN